MQLVGQQAQMVDPSRLPSPSVCWRQVWVPPPLPPSLPGKLDLTSDPWPKVSSEAKDCVRRMLEPNPAKRATADEILQHPWMRENGVATDKPLDNVILKRMT